MAITTTPRKETSNEQTLMRRDGQYSELFAVIDDPATVYTATLNLGDLPADNDEVAEIEVSSGAFSGTYATAYAGMTIRIGSTAGASDLGVCRLREDVTTTGSITIYIGETSDVDWVVDPQVARYITIVDEFRVWPRLVKIVGPTTTTPSANASGTKDSLKVYGTVSGNQAMVNSDGGTTITGSVGGGFLAAFAPGDWLEIVAPSSYIYREVDTVVNDTTLTVTVAVGVTLTSRTMKAIKTHFTRDARTGYNITLNGASRAIVSIESGMELTVDRVWGATFSGSYTLTALDVYMDYDVSVVDSEYSNANNQYTEPCPPVPILGADRVIDNYENNPIAVALSASASYQIDGSISAYLWDATGGTLSSTTSATPTLTIDAAGTYRYSCRVTGVGGTGRPSFGHRKVYVFDRTHRPFTLMSYEGGRGDKDSGWSARITVYGDASTTQIRDQAKVIIFARDHYGTTQQSIGQLANSQNIVMEGWIVGETIDVDPEQGTVTFEIQGPLYWLDAINGVPTGTEDTNAAPILWTEMYHLTVDRMLWHLLVWRSTLTLSCDLHLTGDTRRMSMLEGKAGSLSSQVGQISQQVILARCSSDRYGRVVIEDDPQMIPSAARTTPNVKHFSTNDLRAGVSIERRVVNACCSMTVSGVSWDGSSASAYTKTLPGKVFKTHGRPDSISNLSLANQTQCDNLAALALANRNNPFPRVTFSPASICRLIDICPAMYVTIDAEDNERGLALDRLPILPTGISESFEDATGVYSTEITGEGYTDETTRIEAAPPFMPFSF